MEMSSSGKKTFRKSNLTKVEELRSGSNVEKVNGSLDLAKRSEIGKWEKKSTDQKERWDAFVSFSDKWNEATRIQKAMVGSAQELENAKKEVETLKQVLEELKGKDRNEQQEYLKKQEEFLQSHKEIQALVQKKLTNIQKKWLKEHSDRIERYKEARKFIAKYIETFIKIDMQLGIKFDISGIYNSMPTVEIKIDDN